MEHTSVENIKKPNILLIASGAGLLIVVVLVAVLALASAGTQTSKGMEENSTSSATTSTTQTTKESTPASPTSSDTVGEYVQYNEDRLDFASSGNVIIFFHAPWCPSCAEFDRNLRQSAEDGNIPADLLVLKTDYDTSTSLRQKYGVTLQHTYVQVDAQGNLIKKWNGLYNQYTLEDILKEII